MCAAHRRSEAPFAGPDAVAPPSAPPRAPGRRDRWRAARARRRGVVVGDGVVVGRDVVFDLDAGAHLELGDGVALSDGCRFHLAAGAVVRVGPRTMLGDRCAVTARTTVTIGARCVLGDEVVIIDAAPLFEDPERPVREQGLAAAPISVGDDVRLGPSAALLCGAHVAAGAVVPAHTVLGAAVR
ncbi:MAG TPA: hypothetical protein VI318_01760 [Baekduia sp.]